MKKKIQIDAVPDLGTSVGLQGSMKQKEVGGAFCVALALGLIAALPW